MSSLPKVLVLVAAYNGLEWLPEQVESILNQEGVELFVCFSVDLSNDGTEQWVDSLVRTKTNVNALRHGSSFGGAARNFYRLLREVDIADFDYISLADQDDVWYPDKLKRACIALEETKADGYSSNVIAFWSDGERRLIDKAQPQKSWDYLFQGAGPGCTYVMTRRLATLIKKLISRESEVDEVLLHDWLFYAVARSHGYKWFIDPVPSMLYRQHGSNQFGANSGIKAIRNRMNLILSGLWPKQSLKIASVVGKEQDHFVKKRLALTRMSFIKLAFSANACRRRRIEQMFFFIVYIVLAIIGIRN